MNELETFVYNVLNVGRLDATAVLALADWLIDHDDARGPLLRARCKRWKKAIDKATAEAEAIRVKFGETLAALRDACNAIPGMEYNLPSSIVTHHGISNLPSSIVTHHGISNANDSFHAYLREKFKAEDRSGWAKRMAEKEAAETERRRLRAERDRADPRPAEDNPYWNLESSASR